MKKYYILGLLAFATLFSCEDEYEDPMSVPVYEYSVNSLKGDAQKVGDSIYVVTHDTLDFGVSKNGQVVADEDFTYVVNGVEYKAGKIPTNVFGYGGEFDVRIEDYSEASNFKFTAVPSIYDVKSVETIVDGVTLTKVRDHKSMADVYIVEADLAKVNVVTEHANDSVGRVNTPALGVPGVTSKETVGKLAERLKANGENIVAAINADFFDMTTGLEMNAFVKDGMVASEGIIKPNDLASHSAIYFDENGVPYISIVELNSKLTKPDNSALALNYTNMLRWSNFLVGYNSYFCPNSLKTITNEWGVEVAIQLPEELYANQEYECEVVATRASQVIPKLKYGKNQMAFSGHGTAATFLSTLAVGNKVKYKTAISGVPAGMKVKHLVGGYPQILKHGSIYVAQGVKAEEFDASQGANPRSGVAYNQDKSKIMFFCVDGRSETSKGINLMDFAYLMKNFGAYDGLNFDGGGSTALWAGDKIVNVPSETRAVANCLVIKK